VDEALARVGTVRGHADRVRQTGPDSERCEVTPSSTSGIQTASGRPNREAFLPRVWGEQRGRTGWLDGIQKSQRKRRERSTVRGNETRDRLMKRIDDGYSLAFLSTHGMVVRQRRRVSKMIRAAVVPHLNQSCTPTLGTGYVRSRSSPALDIWLSGSMMTEGF